MFSILFLSVLRQNYEMALFVSLGYGLRVTMPDANVVCEQETQCQAVSTEPTIPRPACECPTSSQI